MRFTNRPIRDATKGTSPMHQDDTATHLQFKIQNSGFSLYPFSCVFYNYLALIGNCEIGGVELNGVGCFF